MIKEKWNEEVKKSSLELVCGRETLARSTMGVVFQMLNKAGKIDIEFVGGFSAIEIEMAAIKVPLQTK